MDSHKESGPHHAPHHRKKKTVTKLIIALVIVAALIIFFNQYQINAISGMVVDGVTTSGGSSLGGSSSGLTTSGSKDLANLNLAGLKSTGHTLAAVFPVENIQTSDDAMAILFPTGTPDYGADLGVSYDTPVESLAVLARMYPGLMNEVKQNDPTAWDKYLSLALKPVGISCEYCCGLGPVGIREDGSSACGCQHNPALLSVALYLSAYTDYSDGEILREVMNWKTLFFPKNMIELGMTVAGGDTSALDNLPGMVGGC